MALEDKLESVFNKELISRLLVKYFHDKGFTENFDNRVYPPIMQDLPELIPELSGKVELEAFAEEIDPTSGFAKLGWNLFALGNQRMYLGQTEHSDLQELAQQLESSTPIMSEDGGQEGSRRTRSARDIVTWLSGVLSRSESGIIRTVGERTTQPSAMGSAQATNFFEKPRAIRPEGGNQH